MNTHVRERAIFVQSSPAFLTRLDTMIEELIAMRDALDGDADFEPGADDEEGGDDEPTLGAPEVLETWDLRHAWARGAAHEGEAEVTIATTSEGGSQAFFTKTSVVPDDAEDSFDAERDVLDEPHDLESDEPSLGWTDAQAAAGDYSSSFYDDAELDEADDEDGDEDTDIADQPHDWDGLEPDAAGTWEG